MKANANTVRCGNLGAAYKEQTHMLTTLIAIATLHGVVDRTQVDGIAAPNRFQYSRIVMGVRADITLYADDSEVAKHHAELAFERLERIESELSDYRVDSAVSRLNAMPRVHVDVPADLLDVMRVAERVRLETQGAYSPYLGSLTSLWRSSRDSARLPTSEELVKAGLGEIAVLENHPWVEQQADKAVTRLMPESLRIDLGGIGKGFAAHEAVKTLAAVGSARCMVAIAGDIALGDPPPDAPGWVIAVGSEGHAKADVMLLHNICVSTSGDAAQFVDIGGARYSHIIDPATGLGCTNPWESTVIANDGAIADALATALCVKGPRGMAHLSAFPSAAALVQDRSADWNRYTTANFPSLYRIGMTEIQGRDPLDMRLEWFRHARFGMFIHWGLYSIPAGYWDGKRVDGIGEWIMHNGGIPADEYERLAPKFNPVNFDASEWMGLAQEAGMKYFVITSKHHDGFCLFDSVHTAYDIKDATPFRKDIMAELAGAARRRGLRVGWYHSIMDWHHPDAKGERFSAYEQVLKAQVSELLTNYGPIDLMWFDGEWIGEWNNTRGRELYNLCRTLQPNVLINNRVGKSRQGMAGLSSGVEILGDFGTPEQEVPAGVVLDQAWESCMTMNDTWGFRSDDHNFKSGKQLIRTLIETVSKGGNFLLNIGPTADGRIPEQSISRLKEIGRWMRLNGESIYGKTAAPLPQQDFGRCTFGDGALYLHLYDLPREQKAHQVTLKGGRAVFSGAEFLADARIKIHMVECSDGLHLQFDGWPADDAATVVKLSMKDRHSALLAEQTAFRQTAPEFDLSSRNAKVHGGAARYESDKDCIGYWTVAADYLTWNPVFTTSGSYKVILEYACEPASEGSEIELSNGSDVIKWRVSRTEGWTSFRTTEIGRIRIVAGGFPVSLRAKSKPGLAVMNLKSVRFVPVDD